MIDHLSKFRAETLKKAFSSLSLTFLALFDPIRAMID